jgi:hypothetical protein
VDQFRFPYDIWSRIVPATVKKMREAVKKLAVRFWWETGVDMAMDVVVRTDDQCSDLMLVGIKVQWKDETILEMDVLDTFQALLEQAIHGFVG